jgi:hypothetical protein
MSSARPGNPVPSAIAATVAALVLSYVVAAGLMPDAKSAAGGAQAAPRGTPPGLALSQAPELRARPALFRAAPAIAQPAPTTTTPQPAAMPEATPADAAPATSATAPPSTTATTAPSTTSAPTTPAQSAPAAPPASSTKPKPRRTPTLSAQPTKPAKPDFDEASPGGFDSSG